jgi:hypothetical protein
VDFYKFPSGRAAREVDPAEAFVFDGFAKVYAFEASRINNGWEAKLPLTPYPLSRWERGVVVSS